MEFIHLLLHDQPAACFYCRRRLVRRAGAIIYRGIVILNAPGNCVPELLPVITRRDALSFPWVADKSSFKQDRRNLDVAQNMKTRVAYASIEDGNLR